jgi:hypothetical protein
MDHKHKYFISGILLGFCIPLLEHFLTYNTLDPTNVFEEILVFGDKIWQYVFLYLIVINSVILYVKRFRAKINPESRLIFLISGVALGFAIISIISATINLIS